MRRLLLRLVALSFALLAPLAAGAQDEPAPLSHFSIQGGLMQSSLASDDLEDDFETEFDAGFGFFALASWHTGPFSLGGGVQRTTHGVEFNDEDLAVLSLFAEPRMRFTLAASPRLMPYVAARVGYSKLSSEVLVDDGADEFTVDVETSGIMFGGGAGLLFALTPNAAIDAGAHFNSTGYGDVEVSGFGESETIPDSDGRANQLAFRVGVSFRFGAR